MKHILLKNGVLINEGEQKAADLLIRGERIEKIASSIEAAPSYEIVDLKGKLVIPGIIDDQVHLSLIHI